MIDISDIFFTLLLILSIIVLLFNIFVTIQFVKRIDESPLSKFPVIYSTINVAIDICFLMFLFI